MAKNKNARTGTVVVAARDVLKTVVGTIVSSNTDEMVLKQKRGRSYVEAIYPASQVVAIEPAKEAGESKVTLHLPYVEVTNRSGIVVREDGMVHVTYESRGKEVTATYSERYAHVVFDTDEKVVSAPKEGKSKEKKERPRRRERDAS